MTFRISIEGNIGSGKSESLKFLEKLQEFTVFHEPLDQWGELLDLYYENSQEWALPFTLKVLLGFMEPGRHHDDCIVERSPLACRQVFGQLMYNDGTINCHEWDLVKEYHDVLGWEPDAILYIDTPVDVCMDRIRQRGRACETHITETYLRRVEFQYGNMLRFSNVPVVKLDGTLPTQDLHTLVLQEVRRLLAASKGT